MNSENRSRITKQSNMNGGATKSSGNRITLSNYNSVLVKVLSVSGILLGGTLIFLSRILPPTTPVVMTELIFAFGLALAPSGVIGLVGDYLVFGRTMETLVDQVDILAHENKSLGVRIQELQVSTEFLKQSSELGLEMIYQDRTAAMKIFAPLMRKQAKNEDKDKRGRLIIVGSSIKGLLESIPDLKNIIHSASKNPNCDFHIMLTHPHYCRFRENQEERPPGAIEEEIYFTMLALEENWAKDLQEETSVARQINEPGKSHEMGKVEDLDKSIEHNVKLYKGTPTCFMIIAGDQMLINPYPYEKEAYKSFCLLVREIKASNDTEEVPKSIYQQYYNNHFENPWKRNALPYQHFSLEGPIPINSPNEQQKEQMRYGDAFVIQDSGKFHLIIVLSGDRRSIIRGVPPSIPYEIAADDVVRTLRLGDEFKVMLLPVTENADSEKDCWEPASDNHLFLKLDADRRSGKFSCEHEGNFLNEFQMIGLFGKDNKDANPFLEAPFAKRKDLINNHLPLFWYWIKEKPVIPPHDPIRANNKPTSEAEE